MSQEEINKLFEISKNGNLNSILENQNQFQKFFRHFLECVNLESYVPSNESIINDKTFSILDTIFHYPEIIEYEYAISNILDTLRWMQEKRCWKVSQTPKPSCENINLLLQEFSSYQRMLNVIEQSGISTKCEDNAIVKNSISQYKNSQISIYYIDALTKILSENYLEIDKQKIDQIMSLLEPSTWLKEISSGKSMLSRDLILKYIERILSIKEFVSEEELSKDFVVRAILHNEVRDKKLLKNLFQYLKPSKLFSLFDYKIENLIQFIGNLDYVERTFQEDLLFIVIGKCANEEFFSYLLPIFCNQQSLDSDFLYIFDDDLKKKMIHFIENGLTIREKNIQFAINSGSYNKTFLSNGMFFSDSRRAIVMRKMQEMGFLSKGYFEVFITPEDSDLDKLKKLEKYNLTGRVVEYEIAISLLDKYFHHQISLDMESMQAIVRSIITHEMVQNGIQNLPVIFGVADNCNGRYFDEKVIFINTSLIEHFLNVSEKMESRFQLFITMFHEMRHALQYKNIESNQFDYIAYFTLKEDIIAEYDPEYYSKNYEQILCELDARQGGCLGTEMFFKRHFPNIADAVIMITQKDLEEYSYSDYSKKSYSVSSQKNSVELIFDRIINLHPEILEKYPVFQLEYTLEGIPKSPEELEPISDYGMELFDEIKKRRGNLKQII